MSASQPPLKERAFRELRALLLEGGLPAGTILSERQLVAHLEMSKTPIRVALERLERDGFIEILPQRGVRVRALTPKEVADLFDLRIALESWVCERVAATHQGETLDELRAIVAEQEKAADAADQTTFSRLDADFHDLLCQLSDNDAVVAVMRQQRDKLFRVIGQVLHKNPRRVDQSWRDHLALVEHLERGDAEGAIARLRGHLVYGRDILPSMEPEPARPFGRRALPLPATSGGASAEG